MRKLFVFSFYLIISINIFADPLLFSPKIKLNSNDQRIIEIKIENVFLKDKDIVLNSIKLKWNLVKNEFQDLTKDLKFN